MQENFWNRYFLWKKQFPICKQIQTFGPQVLKLARPSNFQANLVLPNRWERRVETCFRYQNGTAIPLDQCQRRSRIIRCMIKLAKSVTFVVCKSSLEKNGGMHL